MSFDQGWVEVEIRKLLPEDEAELFPCVVASGEKTPIAYSFLRNPAFLRPNQTIRMSRQCFASGQYIFSDNTIVLDLLPRTTDEISPRITICHPAYRPDRPPGENELERILELNEDIWVGEQVLPRELVPA